MANLDLVPDPKLVVIQASLFFSGIYVINRFFVRPYSAVLKKRADATFGSQEETSTLREQIRIAQEKISHQLEEFRCSIKASSEDLRARAQRERKTILAAAEQKALDIVVTFRKELEKERVEEARKLPELARALAEQLADRGTN